METESTRSPKSRHIGMRFKLVLTMKKRVEERLRMNSLQTFLPVHRCRHLWKKGARDFRNATIPLLPVFAALQFDRVNVLRIPGVLGLASSSAHIPSRYRRRIEALRAAVENLSHPHPYLNAGDRVRIISGP